MKYFVYILECVDGTFYTGYTTDLEKRLAVHNGTDKTRAAQTAAARYTRGRRPVSLVYSESLPTRSAALKREYAIKQLTREEKLELIKRK